VYYKRAVDFYYTDSEAFVYSVPSDAASKDSEFTVTASRSIFVGSGKMSVPVAVVGLQYNYSSFYSAFFKIAHDEQLNCPSEQVDCFVLDNNAFVIIGESYKHVGKFFGELNFELLQDLVRVGVYRQIHFYDYQAICIDIINTSSSSMSFLTPLTYLRKISIWFASKLIAFYLNLFSESWLVSLDESDYIEEYSESKLLEQIEHSTLSMYHCSNSLAIRFAADVYDTKFNKSRPKTCDKEFHLYELSNFSEQNLPYTHNCKEDCSR